MNQLEMIKAAGLNNEQLSSAANLIRAAQEAINSVEATIGQALKYELLVPDPDQPTLWTQLFNLQQLFAEAQAAKTKQDEAATLSI